MFEIFAKSIMGESHRKNNNKPCEDSSGSFENEILRGNTTYHAALAVVADGHGGDKYFRSRYGSKLAVETAREQIYSFINTTAKQGIGFFDASAKTNQEKTADNLVKLERKIISVWREKVLEHKKENQWTKQELDFCKEKSIVINEEREDALVNIYGTTLIAALVTENFWFVLHIGDGACVVIHKDGAAEIAVPEDEEQGFGITHSLCNVDAKDHFRHNFGFEILLGATVASDGIEDSYPKDKYLEFNVTNLLKNFIEQPEQAKKELEETFLPMLSKNGSQDDVSLACIFNVEAAKPLLSPIVYKAKLELEVNTAKRTIEQLKNELTFTKQEKDDWQKKYESKEQTLNFEKEAHNKTRLDSQALVKEKSDLQTKLASLEKSLNEEQKKYKDTEKQLKQLEVSFKKELDKEKRNSQKLERELEDAGVKLDQLEQKIKDEKKKSTVETDLKPAEKPQIESRLQSVKMAETVLPVAIAVVDEKSAIDFKSEGAKRSAKGDYNGAFIEYFKAAAFYKSLYQSTKEKRVSDEYYFCIKELGINSALYGEKYFKEDNYLSAKEWYEKAKAYYHTYKDDKLELVAARNIEQCNKRLREFFASPQRNSGTTEKSQIDISI
ncbi:MAG: protein phosphatase 2C domain-containing protein [Spirochaetaceae bacterium]|jgi:serine/threonine protein phosphatase PrpC|nr:protein phosphatase 2C domain-containing protein [Spirochaetaceae bacterium]